ncbi:hypothetical protein D5086_033978, partial [Populus alba]
STKTVGPVPEPQKGSLERIQVITDATEAQAFTARNFITGSSWLKSTTFPFSLGL